MLTAIEVQQFRNLHQLSLQACAGFNIISGKNGSGKSSILEAIHYLSLARSFRTHLHSRVIENDQDYLVVRGRYQDGSQVGIQKYHNGKMHCRINGEDASIASMATLLPLQFIHPDGYHLVTGGQRSRREFIDWGVFHVEHSFLPLWRRAARAIKHRNAALRQGASNAEIIAWNAELMVATAAIDPLRKDYVVKLQTYLNSILSNLLSVKIDIEYQCGWDASLSYQQVLESTLMRDRALGYTQKGPHRAGLAMKVGAFPAADVLSRGQLKLLVCALRLAQGRLLAETTGKRCSYLVDDFAAELDADKRALLLSQLDELAAQVFITVIDRQVMDVLSTAREVRMFHVEHGVLREDSVDKDALSAV